MRVTAPAAALAILLAALATGAPAARAVTVSDLSAAPLERAAFTALPAVYLVRVDIRVRALDSGRRRYRVGGEISFLGAAFGVAPGRVVTARHLLSPPNARLVEETLATADIPGLPADTTVLRAIADPAIRIRLVRATTERAIAESPAPEREIRATLSRTTDPTGDLALLHIDDAAAPTLALDDGLTDGTPVAAIGFGGDAGEPVVRPGVLLGPRRIAGTDDARFAGLSADVQRGDSGGPVVDAVGGVHGVILRRRSGDIDPVVGSAAAIRALLTADGATPGASAATLRFRQAMEAFWRRDYRTASTLLSDLGTRSADATLVRFEAARAASLAAARYEISGTPLIRGAILAVGAMATICAAIFGALLLRRRPLIE